MAAPDLPIVANSAKRGFHIQTTPLSGGHETLLQQVDAFRRGKADGGNKARNARLSLQHGVYAAKDEADAKQKVALACEYYKRFENISGPGKVAHGMIDALPRKQSMGELAQNQIVCPPAAMIDRRVIYAEAGIDEIFAPCGYGQSSEETLEMMQRFSEEIMPHFRQQPPARAA